jgi:hypothetical protein
MRALLGEDRPTIALASETPMPATATPDEKAAKGREATR